MWHNICIPWMVTAWYNYRTKINVWRWIGWTREQILILLVLSIRCCATRNRFNWIKDLDSLPSVVLLLRYGTTFDLIDVGRLILASEWYGTLVSAMHFQFNIMLSRACEFSVKLLRYLPFNCKCRQNPLSIFCRQNNDDTSFERTTNKFLSSDTLMRLFLFLVGNPERNQYPLLNIMRIDSRSRHLLKLLYPFMLAQTGDKEQNSWRC